MACPTPVPSRLYVYDDLPSVRQHYAGKELVLRLLQRLEQALRANAHVRLIDVNEQVEKLARQLPPESFDLAFAAGDAGARVAAALQARSGRFPSIRRIGVTRIEQGPFQYRVISTTGAPLEQQLSVPEGALLALVDDTIYSGLTLTSLLQRLPASQLPRTRVYCLQALAASLPRIRAFCPVYAGLELNGIPERDVSIIKASHLFEPGAIRRADGRDLAFYERPEWLRAWFPVNAEHVIELCDELRRLEADGV